MDSLPVCARLCTHGNHISAQHTLARLNTRFLLLPLALLRLSLSPSVLSFYSHTINTGLHSNHIQAISIFLFSCIFMSHTLRYFIHKKSFRLLLYERNEKLNRINCYPLLLILFLFAHLAFRCSNE